MLARPMSDTPLYFAFGSNLDPEQMDERCPGSRPLFRAHLEHHRLDFTHLSRRWGGGAADILRAADSRVWGVVYALEPDHLDVLDRYEAGYERVRLEVSGDGGPRRVTTYQVVRKGRFEPSRIYLDKMLRWGAHWEFPAGYLEALSAVRTTDGG